MWNGVLREGGNKVCRKALTFGHFLGHASSPVILCAAGDSRSEPLAESKAPCNSGSARGFAGILFSQRLGNNWARTP